MSAAFDLTQADYRELLALLERVTYKPGWEFKLKTSRSSWPGGPQDVAELWIEFMAPDATGREPGDIRVQRRTMLPPFLAADRFLDWLGYEIMIMEEHEHREWLKLDGTCVRSPH